MRPAQATIVATCASSRRPVCGICPVDRSVHLEPDEVAHRRPHEPGQRMVAVLRMRLGPDVGHEFAHPGEVALDAEYLGREQPSGQGVNTSLVGCAIWEPLPELRVRHRTVLHYI